MIRRALELCAGEVRIRVHGATIERFLNTCARGGIRLRHTHRVGFGELHTTVSIRDFRQMRRYMGRTGCQIHILKRKGLPFILHRLRRRYVLAAGLLAVAALFLVMTNFIWVIEIHAQPGISTYELRETLRQAGVYSGVPVYMVNEVDVVNYVRQHMKHSVDYMTVSRYGNMMQIEAFGGDGDPEIQDDKAVTGLVAARDGFITEMQVLGGYPLVETGDTVERGQQLVTAVTPPTTEAGAGYIGHGSGHIYAQTSRMETSIRLLPTRYKRYTGKRKTQFALVIAGKRFNLYFGGGIGADCDKRITASQLKFGKGTVLPIKLIRQDYIYYEAAPMEPAIEMLSEEMEQAALERMQADMTEGAVDQWRSSFAQQEGALQLTLYASCTEDIAREVSEEGATLPEKPQDTDDAAQ